jgi:hypothetical protein
MTIKVFDDDPYASLATVGATTRLTFLMDL